MTRILILLTLLLSISSSINLWLAEMYRKEKEAKLQAYQQLRKERGWG